MKATKNVIRIDDIGRVVIPKAVRETLDIDMFTRFEVFYTHNSIVLRKYNPSEDFDFSITDKGDNFSDIERRDTEKAISAKLDEIIKLLKDNAH